MNSFMPHGYCLRWDFWLVFLRVSSDVLIALAYFSIPAALVYFVRKREGISFGFIFWLFSIFIFSCGITHLFEIWVLWQPVYWYEGWAKLFTAVASVTTAICLWKTIPAALKIPTAAELMAANEELRQQARKREEAERGNQQKDDFLATLSHELRTPLNAILGWTQLLQHMPASLEETRKALEVINRNAITQGKLIDDLLDVSRIASAKIPLDKKHIHVTGVVDAAIAALQPVATKKSISVIKHFLQKNLTVEADPKRLEQIVWNLLSNALKFTPEGGTVTVTVSATETNCEIEVKDTGTGIAPDFLPHIFERFRQADNSLNRSYGGLGIGLALVRELTQLHGGSVHAKSHGEGKGATLLVTLPRSTGQPESELLKVDTQTMVSLVGINILVVDDEKDSREWLNSLLRQTGANVDIAYSAVKALDLIKTHRPHILLSDIAMPEHDGLWLIGQVRQLPDISKIHAIALTALAGKTDEEAILKAGFDVHLSKPANATDLLTAITRLTTAPSSADPASQ